MIKRMLIKKGGILCGVIGLFFLFLPWCLYLLDMTFGFASAWVTYVNGHYEFRFNGLLELGFFVGWVGCGILCVFFALVTFVALFPRYLDISTVFATLFISSGLLNFFLQNTLSPFGIWHGSIATLILYALFYAPSIVTTLLGVFLFESVVNKWMKIRALKEQLDRGAITQREYEQKKKKLLEPIA